MQRWIEVLECVCERCGFVWICKVDEPKRCANLQCKSPYWNKPRVRKIAPEKHARQRLRPGEPENLQAANEEQKHAATEKEVAHDL